jgi:endonuclease YncB( thermonuclease family)
MTQRIPFTLKIIFFLIIQILVLANPVASQNKSDLTPFNGKVIKIVDGDTYDVLTRDYKTIRIRMNGIDAPEKKQAYGQKAKDHLASLCFGKEVKVIPYSYDRNKRLIADSYTASNIDLCREMVRSGYAWHFKKYSNSKILADDENHARSIKVGLWADNEPVAPWVYRSRR